MQEIWKDIIEYEGLYQISNLGRVKSICYKYKHRILKQNSNGSNYLQVCLFKNNTRKTKKVHKLVAIAFLNHEPNWYKIVVDHIDKNPHNNRLSNLRLITQRLNTSSPNITKTSNYIGVHVKGKRFCATIYDDKKTKHLGYYDSEIEASEAYNRKLDQITKRNA